MSTAVFVLGPAGADRLTRTRPHLGAAVLTNPSPDPSPKRGGEKDGSAPPSLLGKGVGGLGSSPTRPTMPVATTPRPPRDPDMSQLAERIAQFRKMANDDPDNELGHFRLGQLLLEDGQFEEAVKSFRRTLELSPQFSKVFQLLGSCLIKLNRRDDAVDRKSVV